MTQTSEEQSQAGQPEATAPTKKSSRKSILAFAVFALGINSTAAYYTLSPPDVALHDLSKLAELPPLELLPQWKASDPVSDPAVAALNGYSADYRAGSRRGRESGNMAETSARDHDSAWCFPDRMA